MGWVVGVALGWLEGCAVGKPVGCPEGFDEGIAVGLLDFVGKLVGTRITTGARVGMMEGE